MVLKVFQNVFSLFYTLSLKERKEKRFLRDSTPIIQINTEAFYVWHVIFSTQGLLNNPGAKSVT